MGATVRLQLPWPVTINRYWGVTRKGIRYVTARGKEYKEDVAWHTYRSLPCCCPFTAAVRVVIAANPPDNIRRDLDNTLKVLLDALGECGVYEDDFLIADLHITREHVVAGGRVLVQVESM